MRYYENIEDSYIVSICAGCGTTEISREEYESLVKIVQQCPIPPEGYGYRLKTDLTWELYELPPTPPFDPEAASEDYEAALERLGVNINDEE